MVEAAECRKTWGWLVGDIHTVPDLQRFSLQGGVKATHSHWDHNCHSELGSFSRLGLQSHPLKTQFPVSPADGHKSRQPGVCSVHLGLLYFVVPYHVYKASFFV